MISRLVETCSDRRFAQNSLPLGLGLDFTVDNDSKYFSFSHNSVTKLLKNLVESIKVDSP